jgi:4-alpha-glucanotransferase
MKKINLIFGCHSHQPVGNFDHIFRDALEKAYLPFINVLEKFPAVKVTLHFTGPLLDWFAENAPRFLERLAKLAQAGQIEIMGGGYYEPLLCAIPERDALDQIVRMQAFCEEHFGRKPRGMWLTERVWEPRMASTLARAGIEYTALDDTHFICSGLDQDDLFGYYMTEDEGLAVKVFPILEKLRYLIPFHQVEESIEFLREHATEDGLRCAVVHDDGEKFGIWPGTYHSVYEEGWLENFFMALTENSAWITSCTYSEYLDKARALGRTYITCASYHEMMAWALPTPMQRQLEGVIDELKSDSEKQARFGPFIRGGFWRSFLAKYEESNNIQKRMLRTSRRLAELKDAHAGSDAIAKAERLLHQGQCNCAYWHGVFGGLYLNHLRTALYEKLIEADRILDGLDNSVAGKVKCDVCDFDADSYPEAVIENSRLALFFNPADGGTLFELDYKPKPFNFCNTLTRREEPYHDALRGGQVQIGMESGGDQSIHEIVRAKESGLDTFLIYDPWRRVSLRDHMYYAMPEADALWAAAQPDAAAFPLLSYRHEIKDNLLRMEAEAPLEDAPEAVIHLCKAITLKPDASSFEIRYDMTLRNGEPRTLFFGVEFAVNLLTGTAHDRYYRSDDRDLKGMQLGERAVHPGLRHIALRDDWQRFECGLRFSAPADVPHFAIETVSQSEGGQEKVYQGSVVVPCWEMTLTPGETETRCITVEIVEQTS